MTDDAATAPRSPGFLAACGWAVRAALGIGALCALVDFWQVALRAPASITSFAVPVLVGVYVLGSLGLVGVLLLGVLVARRSALAAAVPIVLAIVIAAWAFFLGQGVLLRALPSASEWRTPGVLVLGVAAVLAVWPLAVVSRRRMPVAVLVLAWVLVGVGAFGAVRGFGAGSGQGGQGAGEAAAGDTRPNVLFITIDTFRADHVGCYGYTRPTTPAIDGLAKEGVLFARAYAASSWTKPATTSLLTSQYPSMHQTNLELSRIPESEVLLPEAMHDAGYTTAVLSGNPWVTTEYGFNQGVDHFFSIYDERFARVTLFMPALKQVNNFTGAPVYNMIKRLVQGEISTTARDELLHAELARWLDANGKRRFFVYMHMMSPHHPYDPPPPYDTMFNARPQRPPVTNYPRKSYFFGQTGDPLSDAKLADMVARYDGDIRFGDGVIGKIVDTLRRQDLLDKTLIVVTADHGEEFYDHKNWGHGHSVYDELLHVPLIIRYPSRFPAGLRVDAPVQTIDVMPTILELADAKTGAPMAGHSLVGVGEGKAPTGEAYAELLYRYGTGRALILGDKKLIQIHVGDETRTEMYDVSADPQERWSIVPAEAGQLLDRMVAVADWADRHRVDAAEARVTPEMEQRVKALGYVN